MSSSRLRFRMPRFGEAMELQFDGNDLFLIGLELPWLVGGGDGEVI